MRLSFSPKERENFDSFNIEARVFFIKNQLEFASFKIEVEKNTYVRVKQARAYTMSRKVREAFLDSFREDQKLKEIITGYWNDWIQERKK